MTIIAELVGKNAIIPSDIDAAINSMERTFSGLLQSATKPAVIPPIGRIHNLATVMVPTATAVKPKFCCKYAEKEYVA